MTAPSRPRYTFTRWWLLGTLRGSWPLCYLNRQRACPRCSARLPAELWGAAWASHSGGPGRAGDVTVCPSCRTALVFVRGERLRLFRWRRDARRYGQRVVRQIRERQADLYIDQQIAPNWRWVG